MAKYTYNDLHITGANPEKLFDFYTRVMGGRLEREFSLGTGDKVWDVNLGGLLIRISGGTNVDKYLEKEYAEAKGRQKFGMHHLGIKVDNIDEAFTELKANGAEFIVPPMEGPKRAALVQAPENVLIELIEQSK